MNLASPDSANRLRILVLGYIVRGPLGGMAWHHLQYVMGLRDLGHDVYFLEDSDDTPWCCYDPVKNITSMDPSYGLEFARRIFGCVGLGERWAYHDVHTAAWLGPCAEREALLLPAGGGTLAEKLTAKVAKIGEKISFRRFARFELPGGTPGLVSSYIHAGGKIGVLVELSGTGNGNPAALQLAKDLAMQVAAANPA